MGILKSVKSFFSRSGAKSQTRPAAVSVTSDSGFTDPALDVSWIMEQLQDRSPMRAARAHACYAYLYELVSEQPSFMAEKYNAAESQLSPDNPLPSGDAVKSDMISGSAAERLKHYYMMLGACRSIQKGRIDSTNRPIRDAFKAACGSEQGAIQAATDLNETIISEVLIVYIRYLHGVGPNKNCVMTQITPMANGNGLIKSVVG